MEQGPGPSSANEVAEVKRLLENETNQRKAAEEELEYLKCQLGKYSQTEVISAKWHVTLAYLFPPMNSWYIGIFFCVIGRRGW